MTSGSPGARLNLIAVVGPTASGKTALAIHLAQRLDTEIISADSMQIYKGMEIGTAAPTPQQLAQVKHHFVGFLEPTEGYSAGRFQADARKVVAHLNTHKKCAVVVGGAGLYIRALIDGLFEGPAKDEAIRARLEKEAEQEGVQGLYARLETIDPIYANVIEPVDLRRIVRALEVHEHTGKPLTALYEEQRRRNAGLRAMQFALDVPRPVLYERVNLRVDEMMDAGFLNELEALLAQDHGPALQRLKSLGYREMMAYLDGKCSLDEALANMKQNTRRYAKRQLTWFRADHRIHWIDAAANPTVAELANTILAQPAN